VVTALTASRFVVPRRGRPRRCGKGYHGAATRQPETVQSLGRNGDGRRGRGPGGVDAAAVVRRPAPRFRYRRAARAPSTAYQWRGRVSDGDGGEEVIARPQRRLQQRNSVLVWAVSDLWHQK